MMLDHDGTTLGSGGMAFNLILRDKVKGHIIMPKGRTVVLSC